MMLEVPKEWATLLLSVEKCTSAVPVGKFNIHWMIYTKHELSPFVKLTYYYTYFFCEGRLEDETIKAFQNVKTMGKIWTIWILFNSFSHMHIIKAACYQPVISAGILISGRCQLDKPSFKVNLWKWNIRNVLILLGMSLNLGKQISTIV